jgi:hypothetical protein
MGTRPEVQPSRPGGALRRPTSETPTEPRDEGSPATSRRRSALSKPEGMTDRDVSSNTKRDRFTCDGVI